MKLFDSVVIGCDNGPDAIKDANAIRAALEAFCLRVHLYELVQKQDALAFLAGVHPACDYVVLVCHGGSDPEGVPQIRLRVIDQVDGDYSKSGGWESVTFSLTPANIPNHVKGMGRTLICDACGSGQEPFAQAFLQAGYKAYIAPRGHGGVYADAAVLFVIGFFYHLMASTRLDDEPFHHTDQEAVTLAAGLDTDFTRGTRTFHYFS